MTMWNTNYSPEHYPLSFHRAVCSGPGMFLLGESATEDKARILGLRFGAFKSSCRAHTAHPSSARIDDIRTKLVHKDWESLPDDPLPWKTWVKVVPATKYAKELLNKVW